VLACSVIALIVATGLLARQAQQLREAMARQTALNGWEGRLQHIQLSLTEAETGQRGYLLTGAVEYLQPYRQTLRELPQLQERLDTLPIGDPTIGDRLRDIHELAALKLAELAETIRLHDEGHHEAALALVRTDNGRRYMERLGKDIDEVATIVRANRSASNASVVSGNVATERLAIITVTVLIITLTAATVQIGALMAGQTRYAQALGASERRIAASERFIRTITDSVPVRLAYFDTQQRFQFVNRMLCDRFGMPRETLVGSSLSDVTDGTPAAALSTSLQSALEGEQQRVEYRDILPSGAVRHIETQLIPDVGPAGEIRGVFGIGVDITHSKSVEAELNRQTATLNAIVDAIPVMVGVCDTELRYQLVNRSYERWRGRDRREFLGRTLEEMLAPEEFERSLPWVQQALAGETVSYEVENVWNAGARHVALTYIPLQMGDGTIGGFVAMAEDITQHREENLRLLLLSERDPLTGLLNKTGFESYLSRKARQGEGRSLAVLYIDLDRFKPVNDTYGHAAGDEVLRHFATLLQTVVRPSDAVARIGGDEFAVALAGIRTVESAALVAEKIVKLARRPMSVGGYELEIGASVGVAVDADAAGGWHELIARADATAYRAKAAGRGRYALPPGHEAPRESPAT